MTTNKRSALIAFSLLILVVLFSVGTVDAGNIHINGEEVSEMGGFSGFIIACLVGFLALFLALSLTGLALVVICIVAVVVVAAVLGSIVLALLPVLLPVAILVGIIALLMRRKPA